MKNSITDVPGIEAGHWTDIESATGCTVVICRAGAVGGVDVRGGAPGTRETDLLRPENLVDKVHAVLLTGGSAFGLAAADGVMRYLEERSIGFPTPGGPVPIVVGAVLYDLSLGRSDVRPDADSGYAACIQANDAPTAQGNVGAGTGATVGKALGPGRACKGGLGSASEALAGGVIVAALVAVNSLGEVREPGTGRILAGPRGEAGGFLDTLTILKERSLSPPFTAGANTTIGTVATNARLDKAQASRLAIAAQGGIARAIRPAHTAADGDVVFALATGASDAPVDMIVLGALAADAIERAIVHAVSAAAGLHGIPSGPEWAQHTDI